MRIYKYTNKDKKALKDTIEMWEWLAKTGFQKSTYFRKHPEKRPIPQDCCYLCEQFNCLSCYINCYETSFDDWTTAKNRKGKKLYALLFLNELKSFVGKKTNIITI